MNILLNEETLFDIWRWSNNAKLLGKIDNMWLIKQYGQLALISYEDQFIYNDMESYKDEINKILTKKL